MRMISLSLGGLVLTVALAGCSSGSEDLGTLPPVTSVPTTASPSPTATPTPMPTSAVVKPPLAEEMTYEGAGEFVKYWYAVLAESARSGNVTLITKLSDPKCLTCEAYINYITQNNDVGATITGGGLRVVSAAAPGGQSLTIPVVSVEVEGIPGTRRLADGTEEPLGESGSKADFQLRWQNNAWIAARIVAL